jgi:hypothetical protein
MIARQNGPRSLGEAGRDDRFIDDARFVDPRRAGSFDVRPDDEVARGTSPLSTRPAVEHAGQRPSPP